MIDKAAVILYYYICFTEIAWFRMPTSGYIAVRLRCRVEQAKKAFAKFSN